MALQELKIGRSNAVSHPIPFSSFVQFASSWFFKWAGWKPGNTETGADLSFTNLIKVFCAACSLFSPYRNSLPMFFLTGTRCFAHSSVLKYWACALNERRKAFLNTVLATNSMEGRATGSQYIWMPLALHHITRRKDCSEQATLMRIHCYKQDPKAEDQWNLLKIPPNSRSHLDLAWLRKRNIWDNVLVKHFVALF